MANLEVFMSLEGIETLFSIHYFLFPDFVVMSLEGIETIF